LTDKELTWLYEIARTHRVVFDAFVSPYVLNQLKTTKNFESIIVSYQNNVIAQRASAELIFGGSGFQGILPVTAGQFPVGTSLTTTALDRLAFSYPAEVNLDGVMLQKIDSIAYRTINDAGAPGMQILVARHGKVIYEKKFGHHTYDRAIPVHWNDVYDLASLTKILATLPLIMELVEEGVLSMETTLGEMLPDLLANSNKADITLKKALSHYARFKPWIPFHFATLDSVTKRPSQELYRKSKAQNFELPVAEDLFISPVFTDTIYKTIAQSELRSKTEYKYSDLPYYLLQRFLENHYRRPLEELVYRHFYKSIGANYLGYHPLTRFDKKNIVPTENDELFRGQLIHGYVHDQGAALMGGVGGHAGLFGNALDVAKIMQMYMQGGYYGGERYLKESTIAAFNKCYFCNKDVRRGVGFDKPQLDEFGPTCGCVSMTSFGHSGFTGTYTWADPDTGIVYVFLANRIHPDADNRYIIKNNVRTDIQQIIYDAIIE
jgi:CubicO group peptidase (beta-lactamase class C family)